MAKTNNFSNKTPPNAIIEQFFLESIENRRLSSGEKQVLTDWVKGAAPAKATWMLHRAFEQARKELADPRVSQVLNWLAAVVKVFRGWEMERSESHLIESRAYFSGDDDLCYKTIVRHFENASRYVNVCVFTITDDRIADAMVCAAGRGVKVRVLTDDEKAFDVGSDIEWLQRRGVEVRTDDSIHHMHHKFAVFDGEVLLNGSYNWTRGASDFNEENIVATNDRGLIEQFQKEFDRLWRAYS